jgi:hypothetical protein
VNDDELITQMKAALDEVADAPSAELASEPPTVRMTATRWLAVAAAVLLVGVSTAVLVQNRSHRNDDKGSTPVVTNASVVPTTTVCTLSIPGSCDARWYTVNQPDLVAGEVTYFECCPSVPAPGPDATMAWSDVAGVDHGLLMLTIHPSISGEPTLTYTHAAMSDARAAQLQAKVVPGSGLPYVLPDPSMQLLATGSVGLGTRVEQTYTSGAEQVELSVGDYRGQLDLLGTGVPFTVTSVLGSTAYRFVLQDVTYLVWQTDRGSWGTLAISPGLADRVDDIVSTLTMAPSPTPPTSTPTQTPYLRVDTPSIDGTPLPAFDGSGTKDDAIGLLAPGFTASSNTDTIGYPKGPHPPATSPLLLVFYNEWSDQSKTAVEQVRGDAKGGAFGITTGVFVDTAQDVTKPTVVAPLVSDLSGPTRDVIDSPSGPDVRPNLAETFGASTYPYYVLVGPDGRVAWRGAGPDVAPKVPTIVAANTSTGSVPITSTPSTSTLYTGSATGIIDSGKGPMLAFIYLASLPPQGGDIPLAGFDWSMVDGEETRGGVTWTDKGVTVTGYWDGTTFTLSAPPVVGSSPGASPPLSHNTLTPGCTAAAYQPVLDGIGKLDAQALHFATWGSDQWDGRCGAFIEAAFDTPELRAALAPFGDQVTVSYHFLPIQK